MYLLIQFLTLKQDKRALDLLNLLRAPLVPEGAKIEVRRQSRGTALTEQVTNLEDFVHSLYGSRFNELEVECKFTPYRILNSPVQIKSVKSVFRISPTNSQWEATSQWTNEEIAASRQQFFLRHGQEAFLIWHGVPVLPTGIELSVELNARDLSDDLGMLVFKWFQSIFPDGIICDETFGSVDFGGKELLVGLGMENPQLSKLSTLKSLSLWPGGYRLLNSRVDALHSILLNRVTLCQQLAEKLMIAPPVELHGAHNQESVGILYLPSRFPPTTASLESLLIPRDQSTTMRKADPRLGEHTFNSGSNTYFTRKRYDELDKRGFHLPMGASQCLIYFVSPKHCAQLGVNPAEMLVFVGDKTYAQFFERSVDDAIQVVATGKPERERLWEAYEKVWKKFGQSQEIVSFMGEKYFGISCAFRNP